MAEQETPGQPRSARELAGQLATLREHVRRDRRATSVPLLVLGGAAALAFIPPLVMPGGFWSASPGEELQGLIITAAFGLVWLAERHRAVRAGVGSPRGFGVAASLGLVIILLGGIATRLLGPFLTFAVGLSIAGRYQGNKALLSWAAAMGVLGVVNHFHWITNRLPSSLWSPQADPAINLFLALLTVAAGIVFWRRESHAR